MTEEYDPFKGDSGLKDDFDGTIKEMWFATDPNSNNPLVVNAYMKIVADDGEEVEPRWACGPDWATYDGGVTVEHPKGAQKGFNNKTKWFRAFSSAMEAGANDVLRSRSSGLEGRGPKDSRIWPGLRFHFNVLEEPYDFMKDGEKIVGTSSTLMMSKYLGEGQAGAAQSSPAGQSSTSSAPASQPASSPTSSGAGSLDHLPATTIAQIRAHAGAKPFAQFLDAVMEIPGLLDDSTAMSALADEGFYNSLKG